jgi:hypothetical protein
MVEKEDADFYVFRISSDVNQKLASCPDGKLNTLYSISFTVGKANAILSFSNTAREPANRRYRL